MQRNILTDIVRRKQQRTTHSRVDKMLSLRQGQESCPLKVFLPQPGRNQALHFRKNGNSVYHNRRTPHARITAHNLLHVIEEAVKIVCQVDTRITPSKINQKSKLRPHVMQDRITLFRKNVIKSFTRRIIRLPHPRHDCPVYVTHATKTNKPNTVQI